MNYIDAEAFGGDKVALNLDGNGDNTVAKDTRANLPASLVH